MAEHLSNWEFLKEFYQEIHFPRMSLKIIDDNCLDFKNLIELDLVHNNISVLENIPEKCKVLKIDFNQIDRIQVKKPLAL